MLRRHFSLIFLSRQASDNHRVHFRSLEKQEVGLGEECGVRFGQHNNWWRGLGKLVRKRRPASSQVEGLGNRKV